MAVSELPNAYTDVTGVVNATAAPEIAALFVQLKALIPDIASTDTPASPDWADIPPHTAEKLRAEIDAFAAAVAAAPTA